MFYQDFPCSVAIKIELKIMFCRHPGLPYIFMSWLIVDGQRKLHNNWTLWKNVPLPSEKMKGRKTSMLPRKRAPPESHIQGLIVFSFSLTYK